MKLKSIILSVLPLLCFTCSCTNSDYISFKEYIEIVKNEQGNQKDIFIFTSSTCSHCAKIKDLIKIYKQDIADNNEINLYELSVDFKRNLDGTVSFNDKTMGYLSGNSSNDGLKQLDNRLSEFVYQSKVEVSNDSAISKQISGNYLYMCTPLIIFYTNKLEVKLINNIDNVLTVDDNNNYTYSSFQKMMEFDNLYTNWTKTFDLEPKS